MCNTKKGKFDCVSQKRKMATESTVTCPKYIQIQIFLHISIAHEHGQICIHGCVGEICLGEKFLSFKHLTCEGQFSRNNCFRAPMHFATDRFTFEKFSPPLSLLHPIGCTDWKGSWPVHSGHAWRIVGAVGFFETSELAPLEF